MSRPISPARAASAAAWARVSILLNLGDVTAASAAAVEASAVTHWFRCFGDYQCLDTARIYDTPDLPTGWMWFEPARDRVLVSRDVVRRYGLSPQLFRFADAITRLDAPAFRFFDLANWKIEEDMDRARWGLEPI